MPPESARTVRIGCVGLGPWGSNIARTLLEIEGAEVVALCDQRPERLTPFRRRAPQLRLTGEAETLLDDRTIEGIVIASHAGAHASLAQAALNRGKAVFVEKPLALNLSDAEATVELAERTGRLLMVGHLMLYHPAIERLRTLVRAGELGEILYLYSQRVNLGTIRTDENALWCFGPHDVSMALHLLGESPVRVQAFGHSFLRDGVVDVVFVWLSFASGRMAQLHLSWLDPNKIRRLTLVGRRKMAVFDDMEPAEKLRIYDKGVSEPIPGAGTVDALTLRFGEIQAPRLPAVEPLRIECAHFLGCIRSGQTPRSGGQEGLQVIRVLEAAQRSLDRAGAEEAIAAA
ncbi:MAG: oxidoreductase [Candidatus Omnitrophica bacterium CG11_big_fil_rev_8_21_14_0_20_64_10]|nr:MAG: oxidoreductase [Candidatus Omnitrophica bacterium CG11_big_fil_rev_8_21_14_0_20_64_10]